ncbi:hypothetical protein [Pararobbsia alpina]|nr:hypothetical protein [Pararobbsia alpina]
MLTGMRKSVQAELDEFFAHLQQQAQLLRQVSEQAFAQARAKLSTTAIPALNDWLIEQAGRHGYVPRWNGLRLVAADASTVRFGLRAGHVKRAALPDQLVFGLFLPDAELMLAASLHSVLESEREMLFEHLDRLSSDDLLLLDRGYPCRWPPAVLNQRGIPFCMRVEQSGNGGFACVRQFLRSGLDEQIVTPRAPDHRDRSQVQSKSFGLPCSAIMSIARAPEPLAACSEAKPPVIVGGTPMSSSLTCRHRPPQHRHRRGPPDRRGSTGRTTVRALWSGAQHVGTFDSRRDTSHVGVGATAPATTGRG